MSYAKESNSRNQFDMRPNSVIMLWYVKEPNSRIRAMAGVGRWWRVLRNWWAHPSCNLHQIYFFLRCQSEDGFLSRGGCQDGFLERDLWRGRMQLWQWLGPIMYSSADVAQWLQHIFCFRGPSLQVGSCCYQSLANVYTVSQTINDSFFKTPNWLLPAYNCNNILR